MKPHLITVLFLAFASSSFGQESSTLSTQPSSPEKPKLKDFGRSLKKFGKKEKDNSKDIQNNSAEDEETIRVKTDLVVSDVLVFNQKGNVILGLDQNDFVVTEDGAPQKISVFSFGENASIPRSIVLIIDHSTSLKPFMKSSFRAARNLIDKLAPRDRMAIITDDVKLLVDFTKDKDLLKKKLDNLESSPYGLSKPFTALVATLNEMFDEEDIRPIVIFQTDGDELPTLKPPRAGSKLTWGYPASLKSRQTNFSFEDVCSLVNKSRATIYSIIPGFSFLGLSDDEQAAKMNSIWGTGIKRAKKFISESQKYLTPEEALTEIAHLSGGYADYIEKPEDSENVYSNIFKVINNRYVIGYYPINEEKDGKRRNVKIEVKGRPEYIVTGRKAYIAPVEED